MSRDTTIDQAAGRNLYEEVTHPHTRNIDRVISGYDDKQLRCLAKYLAANDPTEGIAAVVYGTVIAHAGNRFLTSGSSTPTRGNR